MLLNINKPVGISSYDVIRKLKKLYPNEKIGHGGTLDPLASGVLVIAVGKESTKSLSKILKNAKKGYEAVIKLGEYSETDDKEGPFEEVKPKRIPSKKEVEKALSKFIGEIAQIPPKYSAIKIKGVPAYKRARRGEKIVLKPRKVIIYNLKLVNYTYPFVKIEITVGSGTYIRSLARDIGKELETGAYLYNLRRTFVGGFKIENSIKL